MPTEHIISLLIAERDKLSRAIGVLQGTVKRRGRPPQDAAIASAVTPAPARKRRRQSAARRKAQSQRMKAYWAAKRKKAVKKS